MFARCRVPWTARLLPHECFSSQMFHKRPKSFSSLTNIPFISINNSNKLMNERYLDKCLSTHPLLADGCYQNSLVRTFSSATTITNNPPSYCAGQPTPETHPELLSPGEITVGITADEYAARRKRLVSEIPANGVVLLPSGNTVYMSGIIPYPFRQDADFFYLSGMIQPGVLALTRRQSLVSISNAANSRNRASPSPGSPAIDGDNKGYNGDDDIVFTLFIEAPSEERSRWDGARVDKAAAKAFFGADHVHYVHDLPRWLSNIVGNHLSENPILSPSNVSSSSPSSSSSSNSSSSPPPPTYKPLPIYLDLDRQNAFRANEIRQILSAIVSQIERQGANDHTPAPFQIIPFKPLLHTARFIKSPAEADMMRRSAQIACRGIRRCMQICAGVESSERGEGEKTQKITPKWQATEAALAATFEYVCRAEGGAQRMSYPPVVASGSDALTIHYGRNDKVLDPKHLLLMDAGCEFHGFCSDVTRTWPIGGRFTIPQRAVYEVVLEAHRQCVAAARPGSSIRQLHALSVKVISEGAFRLGLFPKAKSAAEIASGLYREVYWHSLGHNLGLDTHDAALCGYDRKLEVGAVITIEPGMYVPDDRIRFRNFAGIGVRIEDDVLITEGGCEVLSKDVPVEVDEIEALMAAYKAGTDDERAGN